MSLVNAPTDLTLTLTVGSGSGSALAVLVGDLEHDTRAAVRAAMRRITDLDGDVSLDLTGVQFMDSTGLALLVTAARDLERRGASLRVVAVSPRVERLLALTGTLELLTGPPTR